MHRVTHGAGYGTLPPLRQRVYPRGGIFLGWNGVVACFGGLDGEAALMIDWWSHWRWREGCGEGGEGEGHTLWLGGVGGGVAVEKVTNGDEVSRSPGGCEG